MTEHSIEKLMFKSSDGGVFDTPEARHHLSAKRAWLTFYTATKIVIAISIALFLIADTLRWAVRDDRIFWQEAWISIGLTGLVLFVFFVVEKNVFWGLRAYLDAVKRNDALEEKIRSGVKEPIYSDLVLRERDVSASKDRFLSFLFVLSKYIFLLIYLSAVLFLTFNSLSGGHAHEIETWISALAFGPILGGLMIWWVIRSEKQIRLTFAGNSTMQSDFEALCVRNAELESQMLGFEGVSKAENQKLEERIEELTEQVEASRLSVSQAQGELEKLRQQLASTQSLSSDKDQALAEVQARYAALTQELEQEQATRSDVEKRLKNLASEFGQNCTVEEAFKVLDTTVTRAGGLQKLNGDGLSMLAKLMRDIREAAHDTFSDAKSLSFVSAEEKRINQYDAIVRLYSQKIQKLRASDMDEEEQQDAIDAMRRLRDREIAELEGSS